jgi:hypothetical protein
MATPVAPPSPTPASPYVRLKDVAAELDLSTKQLGRMSQRGEFPELRRWSLKDRRVLRADFEAWKAGTWKPAKRRKGQKRA